MALRIATLVVLAAAVFFIQQSAEKIIEQNRRVREWPAVDANVTVRFVELSPTNPRSALQARYTYQVGRTHYATLRNDPPAEEWAPAGSKLITEGEASYVKRGHYDPEQPHQLFFAKALGFGDYWPIYFWGPLLGFGVGGIGLRKPGRSATVAMERGAAKGWHQLRPKYSIRRRAIWSWIVALVCNVVVGLAVHDYFTSEPRARSVTSNVLTGIALVPGVVALAVAARYSWLAARVADAHVSLDQPRVTPGTRIAVRIELPVKTGVGVENVTVCLCCIRAAIEGARFRFRERIIWEDVVERDVGRRAQAGGRIVFEQRFTVPDDAQPSAASGAFGPWIDWEIRLACRLADGPDYHGKFQVPVEAG